MNNKWLELRTEENTKGGIMITDERTIKHIDNCIRRGVIQYINGGNNMGWFIIDFNEYINGDNK